MTRQKITKKYLQNLIKEEVNKVLREGNCPEGTGLIVLVKLKRPNGKCWGCQETEAFHDELPWKIDSYEVNLEDREVGRPAREPMVHAALTAVTEQVQSRTIDEPMADVVVVVFPDAMKPWSEGAWVFADGLIKLSTRRKFMDIMMDNKARNSGVRRRFDSKKPRPLDLQFKPNIRCGGGKGRPGSSMYA